MTIKHLILVAIIFCSLINGCNKENALNKSPIQQVRGCNKKNIPCKSSIQQVKSCNKGNVPAQSSVQQAKQDISDSSSKDLLEVASCKPSESAVLSLGEKFNIEVSYEIHSLEKAAIWARPYVNGKKVSGYRAHHLIPVGVNRENPGIADCWFSFDVPVQINEVRIFLKDLEKDKIVKTISYNVNAKWISEPNQSQIK